jgi:hypothetical protein
MFHCKGAKMSQKNVSSQIYGIFAWEAKSKKVQNTKKYKK